MARRCTNSCTSICPVGEGPGSKVRNESTMTMRGENSSTVATIDLRTVPRSLVSASSVRLANRTTSLTFAMSKNVNCCW